MGVSWGVFDPHGICFNQSKHGWGCSGMFLTPTQHHGVGAEVILFRKSIQAWIGVPWYEPP